MKKIKIKVKYLIYIFLFLVLMRFLIIPQGIYLAAKAVEEKDIQVSKVLYKRYAELAVGKEKRAKALYNLAESIVPSSEGIQYRAYIFPNMSRNGNNTTVEMIDNACRYYKEIMEKYKNTSYYSKAYGNTIYLYMLKGNHQEAMYLIEEGINSSYKDIRVLSIKYKMVYLTAERKYEEGISLGEDLVKGGNGDRDVYMLLGDIRRYSRRYEEAKEMYEKAGTLKVSKEKIEDKGFHYYDGEADSFRRARFIDKELLNKEGNNTLYGNVKINGKPVPLALVYVKEIDENDITSSIGIEGEGIMAMTDLSGNYKIEGIKEGKYVLGVDVPVVSLYQTTYQAPKEGYVVLKKGVSKEINFTFVPPIKTLMPKGIVYPVDNKVNLQWEKVEGAAYYHINVVEFHNPEKMEGNSTSGSILKAIYDTKGTLEINRGNMVVRGFSLGDSHVPNPQAYLGSFYPGCKTPIFITAYDAENRCIGSSNAIKMEAKDMIIVSISEKELTEGDKLILKGQPEKALKLYEEILKKNPNDIHALEVLSKLYSIGTKIIYDESSREEKKENVNIERAFQLRVKLYNLTGNNEYIKSLTSLVIDSKEQQKKGLEELKKLPENELDFEQYHFMAEASLKLEDYKTADLYFDKAWEKSTHYVSMDSVILKLYLNNSIGAIKRADNMIDLYLYKINKEELIESMEKLNNVDKSSEDYDEFRKLIKLLLSKNAGYREEYKNINASIQNDQLKKIVNQLKLWYGIE